MNTNEVVLAGKIYKGLENMLFKKISCLCKNCLVIFLQLKASLRIIPITALT